MNQTPATPAANTSANSLAAAYRLLEAGQIEAADRAILAILSREPTNPEALFIHALACLRKGSLAETERAINSVLKLAPGHLAASLLRSEVLRLRGRDAEALEASAQALAGAFSISGDPRGIARALMEVVATTPPPRWHDYMAAFQAFGKLLAKVSSPSDVAAMLDSLASSAIATSSEEEFSARYAAATALLGFAPSSPQPWNREVFERTVLPWLYRALAADQFEQALAMEALIYDSYVKQTENEAHFRDCFLRWTRAMREAGARFAATLPPVARAPPGPIPRIAFFAHNVSPLAHMQMVLGLLEGHALLPQARFEPYLFCLTGEREMLERFRRAGVKVEVLVESSVRPGYRSALTTLRRRIAEAGIDELVWISLARIMLFAFAMRLAPAQAWWAMKYHSLEAPEIDGYLTGGGIEGGTKTIGGRAWRAGPVAGSQWTAPQHLAEASAIRRGLGPHRIVYGSFGREEKLNSAPFLDAVTRILKAVPDSAFVWTGRARHPGIQDRFQRANVADRCHFIGWVDTKLYSQVIDIFLDSFPFPCGFTLYESMATGKPAVLFASPESADTGANALIGPLLEGGDPQREAARLARSIFRPEGEDLYLRAMNEDDYVDLATRLAMDDSFRQRAGAANRTFVERFMADPARAANIYADHFVGILEEAARRRA